MEFGDAHLAKVAREGGLRDVPSPLPELLPELLLILDRAGIDDSADRCLPISFVRHGGE